MYRQFDLRTDDRRMTCWLEFDARLKRGALITLKHDPDTWWSVERVYDTPSPAPPEKRWQVGGLI